MRKILLCLAVVFAVLTAAALGETNVYAVNVGKGDAIIVAYGESAYLIDAGKAYACGAVRRALSKLGITELEGVILTHTDADHSEGIAWLAKGDVPVKNWYASPYYNGKEKKHPYSKAGVNAVWLEKGDRIEISGGAAFTVLAPIKKSDTEENDNSLVMMLETPDGRVLLTGDMELYEEQDLLMSGADVKCDVLKVANHGDGDASGSAFIQATGAKAAIISTDSYEAPGTPDTMVLARLEGAGIKTMMTQGHGAVRATLNGGQVSADYVEWPDEISVNLALEMDADNELFTVINLADSEVNLANWYLYSEKGNEMTILPEYALASGERVVIGTRSSPEGAYEILWDEKGVISNKNDDPVTLYDPEGDAIFTCS